MPGYYRIFDTTFSCNFLLPELPRTLAENSVLSVTMGEGDSDQFDMLGFETAFEWQGYNGTIFCWCERKGDEYLFVFPDSATFHILSTGLISCFLHKGSTLQMLRHLLLNQVIPRYLATNGRLVLHASAITLENGKSVAFLGDSGFGKSTLASSFHHDGAKLINDDCILLECGENRVTVIGGLMGIRLFPDSVNALFTESSGFTNYTPYTDKKQLFLKSQVDDSQPVPCVLDALFLLNDPKEETGDDVCIKPVSGSEAMIAMLSSTFSLDPSDRKTMVDSFQNVAQAMGEHLGLYRLQYPRDHVRLAEVRAAVIKCVEEGLLRPKR